jgi:hypothetical protein
MIERVCKLLGYQHYIVEALCSLNVKFMTVQVPVQAMKACGATGGWCWDYSFRYSESKH